jgi:hypothetical protein
MSDSFHSYSYIADLTADEIIRDHLTRGYPEPGSPIHAALLATLQVRIAEIQRDTARAALKWAAATSIATIIATAVAVVALVRAI